MLQQRMESPDATSRIAAVFATRAGSLGCVAPLLNDAMLPLLQKLQHQMVLAKPQPAGLNPAAFRWAPCSGLLNSTSCSRLVLPALQQATSHLSKTNSLPAHQYMSALS